MPFAEFGLTECCRHEGRPRRFRRRWWGPVRGHRGGGLRFDEVLQGFIVAEAAHGCAPRQREEADHL